MSVCDSLLKHEQFSRLIWLDALRVLACFGIIAIHIWAPVTYMLSCVPLFTWWAGNAVIVLIASWSIPMFVMISGALLLSSPNHEYVLRFFSRRTRLFWQTAFWTAFFVVLRLATESDYNARQAVVDIKYGIPFYHMWFLNMILGLYVCTPILCRFVRSVPPFWRITSMLLILFLSMVWPLVQRYYFPAYQQTLLTLFMPFIGYYLLGYELMNIKVERNMAPRFAILFMSTAVLLLFLSFLAARKTITILPVWWLQGAFSPMVLVMSVSLFQFFHAVGEELANNEQHSIAIKRFAIVVEKLTPLTLGIYIIHPLFIRLLTHIGLIDVYEWGGAGLAVNMLIVFLWSAVTIWAISRIPYIRILVSGGR